MTSRLAPQSARRVAASLLATGMLALASGCSMNVADSPSLVRARGDLLAGTPARWTSVHTEGAALGDAWWTEFGDPVLDGLVAEALAHNHDLAAAAARVAAAAAQARIDGADLYPSLQAGFSAARQRQVFVGLPIPDAAGGSNVLSSETNQYGVSLDLSWEIDLWGRLRAQDAASRAAAEAARIEYEGARLSLAGQTAKAWFTLREATEQLSLAESTLDSYSAAADQVRERYERGTRSPLDLRLALAQVSAAEARVADRRSLHGRAARQLEVLLGRYPAAEIAAVATTHAPASVEVPVGVPAALLARRPDLAAAAWRVYASDQSARSARAALLPRIALTGRAGTVSDDIADLLDGDFGIWTIAGNLVQPIFEGGRLRAAVALADAGASEAAESYASAALRAFAEVETALSDEADVAAVVAALEQAAVQSRAAEALARQRYRSGLEVYVTVLTAQRSALDAESTLLAARRRLSENRVDLHLAIGGGFVDPALQAVVDPPAPSAAGMTAGTSAEMVAATPAESAAPPPAPLAAETPAKSHENTPALSDDSADRTPAQADAPLPAQEEAS